jgi:YXWGXW repeat-containing protein
MRMFRSVRLTLLALLVSLVPASSYAGVFISVGFAPPVLPVYVQPPCPQPGLMWTPGYWSYGPDGYYWVPGAWVPAPYVGALWTPGYWGWGGGLYAWHPGYWGAHVGYYGGVNYGFGYMGVGFAGGVWRGGEFAYNTAVMHVDTTVIHTTYVDNTVVRNTTIVNDRHVAFSGGPGGINHAPTPEENQYSHEPHVAATSFQTQHESTAMHDTNAYASHNGGHPSNLVASRPLQAENHPAPQHVTVNNNINRNVTVNKDTNNYNRNTNNETVNRNSNNSYGHSTNESHPSNGGNHPQEHNAPKPENHPKEEGHGHGR